MSEDATAAADGRSPDPMLRHSAVMAAGTALSRVLGFARSAVLAAALGTAVTADTFTTANTVPNILYILLAGGVLNAVFVPQLTRAMDRPDAGQGYTDRLLTLVALVLAGVTLVATMLAPVLMRVYTGTEYTASDVAVATTFAFWCLPQILFYGTYTVLGQILNARNSFGPMMWTPIVNNLVAISGGLLFIRAYDPDFTDPSSLSTNGIALLGGTATLGVALQAAVLVPVLRRTGFRYRPRFDFRGQGLGKAGDLARWTLLFVLVNQVAYLVVVKLATNVGKHASGEGGLTAYSNAYLLFILPHSIVTVSVVTGLLPAMSRAAAAGRVDELRASLAAGWRLTAVGSVLAAATYLALGPDITGLLFAGGLSTSNARSMGVIAACFAIGLPAFSAQYVALRGFYAQEDTRTPFLIQVAIAATNVALALTAYVVLPTRHVLAGMALAYAATYVVGLLVSTTVLRRRLGGLDTAPVVQVVVRLVVAVAPGALVAAVLAHLLTGRLGGGFTGSLAAVLVGVAVLLGGFLLLARRLRITDVTALLRRVRG